MVDYSKWDHIDVSDDDDEGHPNIDKGSLKRWKKQAKEERKAQTQEGRQRERQLLSQNRENMDRLKGEIAKDDGATKQRLLEEMKVCQGLEVELSERIKKQDDFDKKHPTWDEDTICREGFSKTIVTKSSEPMELPAPPTVLIEKEKKEEELEAQGIATEELPATAEELTAEEEYQKQVADYIRQMEENAHTLAAMDDYKEMYAFIGKHREIICDETVSYMLLHTSDCIKRSRFALSKRYLRCSQISKYCEELGADGIRLFFTRMMDPNPYYRTMFEKDTDMYWEKIKTKVTEMQRVKQAKKAIKRERRAKEGNPYADDADVSTDDDMYEGM